MISLYRVFLCTLQIKPKQNLVNELLNSLKVHAITFIFHWRWQLTTFLHNSASFSGLYLGSSAPVRKDKCDHWVMSTQANSSSLSSGLISWVLGNSKWTRVPVQVIHRAFIALPACHLARGDWLLSRSWVGLGNQTWRESFYFGEKWWGHKSHPLGQSRSLFNWPFTWQCGVCIACVLLAGSVLSTCLMRACANASCFGALWRHELEYMAIVLGKQHWEGTLVKLS